MSATIKGIYRIKQWVKSGVAVLSETENVTPMLLWVMIRQQADHELALIKDKLKDSSEED